MKAHSTRTLLGALALTVGSAMVVCADHFGTAFTYQGKLAAGTNAANGLYDLQFKLYNAGNDQVGPTLTTNALAVTNGLFTVGLDFGDGMFIGPPRWLEIGVKTNGASAFVSLSPRQALSPTPYALYTPNADLAVTATKAVSVVSNAVTSAGIASGNVVKSLNSLKDDVTLSAGANMTLAPSGQTLTLASPTDWHAGGNAGTTPGVDFLGTTDDQPLEVQVNGQRSLRLEPTFNNQPNIVGGWQDNAVAAGNAGGFIGGGGEPAWANLISADQSTIGGGYGNQIGGGALAGFIGGGAANTIQSSPFALIAGGLNNQIQAGGNRSTIAGGSANAIGSGASDSVIPGGFSNRVAASYGLAAGRRASALHQGTFVWADTRDAEFASTASNQFLVRAAGGVGINTNSPQAALHVVGNVKADGFSGNGTGLTSLNGSALADNSVTASKFAPGAMNHLDAPDGAPLAALQVDTNGLVGIGTATPQAGLDIEASGTVLAPVILSQLSYTSAGFSNLAYPNWLAVWGSLAAVSSWYGTESAFTLVDLSNPQAPLLRSQFRVGEGTFTNIFDIQGVALTGSLLAIAASTPGAVTLVDVSDPGNPVKQAELVDGVGGWNDLQRAWTVALSGHLLAIAALGDNAVTLADVANPAHPVQRSVVRLLPRSFFVDSPSMPMPCPALSWPSPPATRCNCLTSATPPARSCGRS